MSKWFHLKGNLILSNRILKNPRNEAIKYMFFQKLMELSTILKSIQVQSCPALVSLIFKHQEILLFNWCNIFHVFNGTSFILTTGIAVFYLKRHFMSRKLLLLALSGVTVFTTASFQMTNLWKRRAEGQQKYGYLVLIMWSYEQSSGLTTVVLPSLQRTNQLNQPQM